MSDLEVFTKGDNDQPTTCPHCGARTNFDYEHFGFWNLEIREKHECLRCKFVFYMEED